MKYSTKLFVCSFHMFNSYYFAFAQSSPVEPAYDNTRREIGAFVGLGQNVQSGDMYVDCIDYNFKGGTKFGYTFGLLYEQEFGSTFQYGLSISYNYLGINSVFNEIESIPVEFDRNGTKITVMANIKFHHEADVDIHNLAVSPYLKWTPFKFMFIRAGLALSTNYSTKIVHTKSLSQKTVRFSTGEIASLSIPDQKVQDSELRNPISFQMYAQPDLGFNIPFSKSVTFSPIFEYNIPFAKISDNGKDLKVNYFRILFELRIAVTR